MKKFILQVRWQLPVLSAFLLIFAFPTVSISLLGWVGLIPLLISLESSRSKTEAVCLSGFSGFIFFAFSILWLTHVTVFGWLFVVFLETSFWMLFGWLAYHGRQFKNPFFRSGWTALAWMTCEILRTEIPVFGFGWNLLGYSQAGVLPVLQAANVAGVYGLSFGMVFLNAVFYEGGKAFFLRPRKWRDVLSLFLAAVLFFALLLAHGFYHLRHDDADSGRLRVSVVQGNVPQEIKWETVARDKIIELYLRLTELAAYERPSLIVWPEAAFPGYINRDREAVRIRALAAELKTPILVGAPYFYTAANITNSAILILPEGQAKEVHYDKINLVPFGEYIPLKGIFGWLAPYAYTLGVSDFMMGRDYTVFHLGEDFRFSVLICFEDVFPEMARRFVTGGADFLTVITNDAWFGYSSAPFQHLQASVFRAVENGVSLVRSANTGVSAFIEPNGKILERVTGPKDRQIFVTGHKTYPVMIEPRKTLFRQGGYLIPYALMLIFGFIFLILKISEWRKNNS